MAQDMKASGKMTCSMVTERRVGQMDRFMKESIWQERNMELVFTAGTMARGTTENGKKTKLKALELILGLMVESTEAKGLTTIWMESVSTLGKTAANTKENTKMIRSKDMEFTLGLMDACTKAIGGGASSMVSAATLYQAHK